MSSSFDNDTIDGFKAFVLCGGSRDQVVREITEYIYTELPWESNWQRSEILEQIIELVYQPQNK
jgi:hypothetical protein